MKFIQMKLWLYPIRALKSEQPQQLYLFYSNLGLEFNKWNYLFPKFYLNFWFFFLHAYLSEERLRLKTISLILF